ncbi:3D domain-containing protein [Clostridium sp. SHJSY1]|uniref:3D domain-containing protein n=1 Tax=Clostridium sp. SHJSY1 TaxID=2942483 RepID=UPI002875F9B6|nr:3D domain-containing protein [Clostridium sp. SHJSY1]MDS0524076.1 3D domain-containing protein [Clostridium sp. SHJSY1]
MKKFTSIVFAIVLLSINVPLIAEASPLDDTKFEFNIVSDEVRLIDVDISNSKKDVEELQAEIATNEESIKKIQTEINSNQGKITSLNEEVNKSEDTLSMRLREMYKSGSYSELSYLAFITEAESVGDFFERLNSCRLLITQDKKLVDGIHEKVSQLTESINSITKQKEDLSSKNKEIQTKIDDIKKQEAIIAENKAKLDAERARIAEEVRQNEDNLIKNSVSIINSSNDAKALSEAIDNLKGLLPQLTTDSVKATANNAIAKGNKKIAALKQPETTVSGGAPTTYKKTLSMEATAYTANSITATGTTPVRNPNGLSTIAVDPRVIPLGSKVYVVGYGYAIAADTGGAIKGNIIDLFLNSNQECINWGRRNVTVYVIAYKGEW